MFAGLVLGCLQTSSAVAQFATNTTASQPSGNMRTLPRLGAPYSNNFPYGLNGGFGNSGAYGFNNPYGFPGGYGFNGFNYSASPFNSYGMPYGYGAQWQYTPNGYAFNNPSQNPYAFGSNFLMPPGPFGGYQYYGYGNFSPIVGMSNGWYPYSPVYDPYNPMNRALQDLFIQGLTGSAPSSSSPK